MPVSFSVQKIYRIVSYRIVREVDSYSTSSFAVTNASLLTKPVGPDVDALLLTGYFLLAFPREAKYIKLFDGGFHATAA